MDWTALAGKLAEAVAAMAKGNPAARRGAARKERDSRDMALMRLQSRVNVWLMDPDRNAGHIFTSVWADEGADLQYDIGRWMKTNKVGRGTYEQEWGKKLLAKIDQALSSVHVPVKGWGRRREGLGEGYEFHTKAENEKEALYQIGRLMGSHDFWEVERGRLWKNKKRMHQIELDQGKGEVRILDWWGKDPSKDSSYNDEAQLWGRIGVRWKFRTPAQMVQAVRGALIAVDEEYPEFLDYMEAEREAAEQEEYERESRWDDYDDYDVPY